MTTLTAIEDEQPERGPHCWCCGRQEQPDRMVTLGLHPEVTICTRCSRSLRKSADKIEDRDRTGPAVRARDAFRHARKAVVRRGWHNQPILGRPLRWLGRHTP